MLKNSVAIMVATTFLVSCEPRTRTDEDAANTSNRSDTTSTTNDNTTHGNTAQTQDMLAVAKLVEIGGSGVAGEVRFQKMGDKVKITGKVTGLKPGEHGFHVHEHGDLSDTQKGESAGGHFNPDKMEMAGPPI